MLVRELHKWIFSLTLILSLSTVVNATSHESISSNNIELVIDSSSDDVIHFYDAISDISFETANVIFDAQLAIIYTNTIYQKIRVQNNELLNKTFNYQLSFLQLLNKKNVLTS